MSKRPTVLMILDGYGLNNNQKGNAVAEAKTPVVDKLMAMQVAWQSDFRMDRWVTLKSDI